MMTIAQLLAAPTSAQVEANITGMLVGLGVPADQWRKGGVLSLVRKVVAVLYAAFAAQMVLIAQFGLLTISKGGWLDLLAFYVYGVTRTPASYATGKLTLTNAGANIYDFGSREAVFSSSRTKATYTNAASFTLGAGPATSLTIDIVAVTIGSGGNANPGDVDTLVTQMPSVTCANGASIVGLDAQSDEDLTVACQQRLSARSVRGPRNAYEYYATHAADDTTLQNALGNPVNVNRVQTSPASHTGVVTTWVAAPSGGPLPEDRAAVEANLEQNVRPEAVTSVVLGATPITYGPTIVVWCHGVPGLQAANVQAVALSELTDFFETYKVGGLSTDTQQGLFGTKIAGVIESTNDTIFDVVGATDMPMVDGQVAVNGITSLNLIVRIAA